SAATRPTGVRPPRTAPPPRAAAQALGRKVAAAPPLTSGGACGRSVAVVLRLVRAGDVDVDVLRLLLGELGELDAERLQVQPRHLLVEDLRQPLDGRALVLVELLRLPERDLREDLVGERRRHHER